MGRGCGEMSTGGVWLSMIYGTIRSPRITMCGGDNEGKYKEWNGAQHEIMVLVQTSTRPLLSMALVSCVGPC